MNSRSRCECLGQGVRRKETASTYCLTAICRRNTYGICTMTAQVCQTRLYPDDEVDDRLKISGPSSLRVFRVSSVQASIRCSATVQGKLTASSDCSVNGCVVCLLDRAVLIKCREENEVRPSKLFGGVWSKLCDNRIGKPRRAYF